MNNQNNNQPINFGNSLSGNNSSGGQNSTNQYSQNVGFQNNGDIPNNQTNYQNQTSQYQTMSAAYNNQNQVAGNYHSQNSSFRSSQTSNVETNNVSQYYNQVNNSSELNMNNRPKKRNKILTIVFVIIGIFVLIQIGIISISINQTTNKFETTRKSTFISSAKSYVNIARSLIMNDNSGAYKPDCVINDVKYISLADLNSNYSSPFGGYFKTGLKYNKSLDNIPNESYIKVQTIDNNCKYEYYIYLTDGTYNIGTRTSPISYEKLDISDVKK